MSFGEYVAYYSKVVSLLVGWTFLAAIVVASVEKALNKNKG